MQALAPPSQHGRYRLDRNKQMNGEKPQTAGSPEVNNGDPQMNTSMFPERNGGHILAENTSLNRAGNGMGLESASEEIVSLKETIRQRKMEVERSVLIQVLRKTGGNKAEAARLLQINYSTIHLKIKRYGIRFVS